MGAQHPGVMLVTHINSKVQRGNKADWNVCVILGMGETDCDIGRYLYRHHIYSFRDVVVVREVGRVMDQFC